MSVILYPLCLIDGVLEQGRPRSLPSSPAKETSDLTGQIKIQDKTLRTELSQADLNPISLRESSPGFFPALSGIGWVSPK